MHIVLLRHPFDPFGAGVSDFGGIHSWKNARALDLADFRTQVEKITGPLESNRQRTRREQAGHSPIRVMHMP